MEVALIWATPIAEFPEEQAKHALDGGRVARLSEDVPSGPELRTVTPTNSGQERPAWVKVA